MVVRIITQRALKIILEVLVEAYWCVFRSSRALLSLGQNLELSLSGFFVLKKLICGETVILSNSEGLK